MVEGADAQMVAWLHDVIEDSAVTAADLRASGIPAHIVDAVVLLTRGPETYATYIDTLRAAQNPLALAVKRADLRDHLRPETAHLLPRSARRRYERALVRLT